MSKDKKIIHNPSVKELSDILPIVKSADSITNFLKNIGIDGDTINSISDSAKDILQQAEILELPDKFNTIFNQHGWIATNSMSVEVMKKAIGYHDNDNFQEAEKTIIDWFTEDNIRLFAINRTRSFNKADKRWEQLNESLKLTLEERYMSAVPLILIASDGFASDIIGNSPFEKDADLTSFDSIVGHSTSLPVLIKQFIKGVRKSSNEELNTPLRHGILHGRSLGYDNKVTCFKAWMLMVSLVDWAIDKQNEESRIVKHAEKENFSWASAIEQKRKLDLDRKLIEEFTKKEWVPPFQLPFNDKEPAHAFCEFLEAWKNKNYGLMAKYAVNISNIPRGQLAGRLRNDFQLVELEHYELQSVTQPTIARAEATVLMRGHTLQKTIEGKFQLIGFKSKDDGDFAMPTDEGFWTIQQGCIFKLINEDTIE